MESTNNKVIVHEAINDNYEWIQYNSQLRIIRSIKDDMYQMGSIIKACNSNKLPKNWFENASTQELLSEFEVKKGYGGIPPDQISNEKRPNLLNELKGYYVHRLLVNAVAMWASPKYAMDIFILLDKLASEERNRLENIIDEKNQTIDEQNKVIDHKNQTIDKQNQTITTQEKNINDKNLKIAIQNLEMYKQNHIIQKQKPRMVPKNKEKSYKYMIWKEDFNANKVILNLVRRNNSSFREVNKICKDPTKVWFYKDNLPISMTVNEDVKELVRQNFIGSDYDIRATSIIMREKN